MLIQVKDISLHYGTKLILDKANVMFTHGQKIAIIGRNGAGKSSLCKIIVGEQESDSGSIQFASDLRLSYLEQKDPFKPEEIVTEFLERYSHQPAWMCAKIGAKFGLTQDHMYMPINSLSGGYQMRVKLTSMMLKDPNFLILDEPTNYLDLSTLLFLERFLQEFRGSFIIVSHDREFLKRTCDHTMEIEYGKATLYKGGVDDFLEYKSEQLNQKEAMNKNIERQKKHLQSFVDRFGSKASLASSAQSKRKQIERLKTIDIDKPLATVNITMPQISVKKGSAVKTTNLAIGYPKNRVAGRINIEIEKGKHVAILGDNGQGKSTFLKTLAKKLSPIDGTFEWGSGVKVGFYAQHVYHDMSEGDTVLSYLERMADSSTARQTVLDMAGCFLFSGDEVRSRISILSGGERARLCLAGLLLSKSDVLLLDEPTNHLDFETVDALATALKTYAGTVLFISHDRIFVNTLATSILEVKDGKIQLYPGTYEEYVYHLETEMDIALK
jgi:ATP-binding cassette subfamily F protein 3